MNCYLPHDALPDLSEFFVFSHVISGIGHRYVRSPTGGLSGRRLLSVYTLDLSRVLSEHFARYVAAPSFRAVFNILQRDIWAKWANHAGPVSDTWLISLYCFLK